MVRTVTKDSKTMLGAEAEAMAGNGVGGTQNGNVECIKCECCGLTEECTKEYIRLVRERYQGRWICGLCAEAVKDDIVRFGTDEALNRHINFCKNFRSSSPPHNPTEKLISAVRQLLRRSLDSPRSSQTRKRASLYAGSSSTSLLRSDSSFSTPDG